MKNRLVTLAIVVVGIAVLVLFGVLRTSDHRMRITTYFENAAGLRSGAPVRFAGVDIGNVASVRARPELRDKSAEVIMDIRTSYDLKIPKDAVASLSTEGVLGQTFVDVNGKNAVGSPLEDGGVLPSQETAITDLDTVLRNIDKSIKSKPCAPDTEKGTTAKPR